MDQKEVEQITLSTEFIEDSVYQQTTRQRFLEMIARLNSEYIDRIITNTGLNDD